jgi:hypothetical protein
VEITNSIQKLSQNPLPCTKPRLRIRYECGADLHHGLLELACGIICRRRLRKVF